MAQSRIDFELLREPAGERTLTWVSPNGRIRTSLCRGMASSTWHWIEPMLCRFLRQFAINCSDLERLRNWYLLG